MLTWNKMVALLLVICGIGLMYLLAPVLTPFVCAALLAYLANPVVSKLVQWGMPRLLSVVVVFLTLFALIILAILLLIPLVQSQIEMLIVALPTIISALQDKTLPWMTAYLTPENAINIPVLKATLAQNWTKAGGIVTWIWRTVLSSGFTFISWLIHLLIIPVVTFYLLRDWNTVTRGIRNLLPRHMEPVVVHIATQCDLVLSGFFRGQLLVMLSLGVVYAVGLMAIGLQLGLMIGMVAGLVSIVPYLGFIVGILSASIAAYVQFGTVSAVCLVFLVFAIGQALESMVLVPKLVGDRIGLHPLAVIFAVLAGGTLFGFFGVLLALPAAAVLMVWLRYLNERYRESQLYQ